MYPFIFALAADQHQQAEHSTRGITWQSALTDANKSWKKKKKKDIMLWLDPVPFTNHPTPASTVTTFEFLLFGRATPGQDQEVCDDGAHSGQTDKNRLYGFSVESPH